MQQIFSRCKTKCNYKGLLTHNTLFLFGFSGRINFHEKVRVTLICIWCGSIDRVRLWATDWHRSASGKCRPESIQKSVTPQFRISELSDEGDIVQIDLFTMLGFFCQSFEYNHFKTLQKQVGNGYSADRSQTHGGEEISPHMKSSWFSKYDKMFPTL